MSRLQPSVNKNVKIVQADSVEHLYHVQELFQEYAASLDIDMCFENIEREIAELPGRYGPPTGCLLLAFHSDKTAGCVAMRRIDGGVCEMKRLYVRPGFRGLGVGKMLTSSVIDEGQRIGYTHMRLDTVEDKMQEAMSLYRSLGFYDIEPYNDHPVPATLFMELAF